MTPGLFSWIFGGAIFVYFIAYKIWKRWVNKFVQFRGPTPTFLLGYAHMLKRDPAEFWEQIFGLFGVYEGELMMWLGLKPLFLSGHPEDAEVVLSSTKHITKAGEYEFLHPWIGTGLLTSTGSKWKQRRRLLTPTFHFSILKDFSETFKENSMTFVDQLKPFAETAEQFDICKYASLVTLDSICEAAMGVKCNAQLDSESDYIKAVLSLSGLIQERQKSPWLWPDIIYNLSSSGVQHNKAVKLLHDFTIKVINEKIDLKHNRKELPDNEDKPKKKQNFLDILINSVEAGDIDIDGLREEVDTFMFEGHDTTASGLSWTLYLLGRNSEIQKKARQEVDEVLDKYGSDNFLDTARELKYVECIIKESMRLYPPVPLVGRAVEEDIKLGNRTLCKGATLAIVIGALHRNKKYWPNPDNFDPDRFLPDNYAKHHPYAYVPFSAGQRNCIGQKFALLELKVIVATFLRHYKIISLQAEDNVKQCGEIVSRARDGLFVNIMKRDSLTNE